MVNKIKEKALNVWYKLTTDKEAANAIRSQGGYVPFKPMNVEKNAFVQGYILGFHSKFSEDDVFEFTLTKHGAQFINEHNEKMNSLEIGNNGDTNYASLVRRTDYKEDDVIKTQLWCMYVSLQNRGIELAFKCIKPTTMLINNETF